MPKGTVYILIDNKEEAGEVFDSGEKLIEALENGDYEGEYIFQNLRAFKGTELEIETELKAKLKDY